MSRTTTARRIRRPELSQHFLRPEAARKLVARLPFAPSALVVEPGAGDGELTLALADAGFRVIAIEKDARLYRRLRARLVGGTNVECHHADFLAFRLPARRYHVVSNVPYSLTSAFVRRLVDSATPPAAAAIVLQREAAAKFAGTPRETLFSLLHKRWFEIEIARPLRRTHFDPSPSVTSVVLHLQRRDAVLIPDPTAHAYRWFVRTHFGHGAPHVARSLRRTFTHRQLRRLARDLGFTPDARCSELTFGQWLGLFRSWLHRE